MKQLILLGLLLSMFSCEIEDPTQPGLLVPLTVDQDASLPSLAINGTILHVETYGNPSDPVTFIIHGGPGGDYRSMLEARRFAEDGFFVVFYDQRGSGLSRREDQSQFGENAVQLMIDDLDALVEHFRQDSSQKVFLQGHSWGAMLATAYINQHPEKVDGAVLAEPGGFTWTQTEQYLGRSNELRFFTEAMNDALYTEQIFAGRGEHEIQDYKGSFFSSYENAEGNAIGNAGPYPFWRNGSVAFTSMINEAYKHGFDFSTDLDAFPTKVLFAYAELNTAYGEDWAHTLGEFYPQVEYTQIKGSGHEIFYFGWDDYYPKALAYLNELL